MERKRGFTRLMRKLKSFVFLGDTPSKKNSKNVVCRGARPYVFPSQAYQSWHSEQMVELYAAKRCEANTVEITIYPSSRRKGDLTNKAESIMDLLVDAGVLEDDNWFCVGRVNLAFGGVDKENPRAEVNLLVDKRVD